MDRLQTGPAIAGQLTVIVSANPGLPQTGLVVDMARSFALAGESVILLDCDNGDAIQALGLKATISLSDVTEGRAALGDAKILTPCRNFAAIDSGAARLENLLGTIAALSLSYDRVVVALPEGCTPAHIRLIAAADDTALLFDSAGDKFMRGFWMMDAIRSRAPHCDPLITVIGPRGEAQESYQMFADTVRDYLGAPPPLAMICQRNCENQGQILAAALLQQVASQAAASPQRARIG